MITVALVPILTLFCLVSLGVFMVHRKASKVAAVKVTSDQKVADILIKDRENNQTFVENIMVGVPIEESLARFLEKRHDLFPGTHNHAGASWTQDDLESWQRQSLDHELEAVSRGSLMPAILAVVVLLAVGTVATAVLYDFQSSSPRRHGAAGSMLASGHDPDFPAALPSSLSPTLADTRALGNAGIVPASSSDGPTVLPPQPTDPQPPDFEAPENGAPSVAKTKSSSTTSMP